MVLEQHGTLRVVLPSAADDGRLPPPAWLARVHAHKLQAATDMRIVCCVRVSMIWEDEDWGPLPVRDTQYMSAYTSAQRSALLATGKTGLAATALAIKFSGPYNYEYPGVWASGHCGVAEVLPALTALLPQLQSVRISSACRPSDGQTCQMVQCLQACPHLHALQLAIGGGGWYQHRHVATVGCIVCVFWNATV